MFDHIVASAIKTCFLFVACLMACFGIWLAGSGSLRHAFGLAERPQGLGRITPQRALPSLDLPVVQVALLAAQARSRELSKPLLKLSFLESFLRVAEALVDFSPGSSGVPEVISFGMSFGS